MQIKCIAPIKGFAQYEEYPVIDENTNGYLVRDGRNELYWLSKKFVEHGLFQLVE